ncbi:hypothetical protein WME89_25925 [Sorangium sp. So ce321]|uniref:hypothetical protein n=1 Tax=Sorangium sp. So ce321 TaxID=3133300 RepID=UPI003F6306D4
MRLTRQDGRYRGEFAKAGVAWSRWHLLGDEGDTGKGMFLGTSRGRWSTDRAIQQKGFEQHPGLQRDRKNLLLI